MTIELAARGVIVQEGNIYIALDDNGRVIDVAICIDGQINRARSKEESFTLKRYNVDRQRRRRLKMA